MALKNLANLKKTIEKLGASSLPARDLKPIAEDLRDKMYSRVKAGYGVTSDRRIESTGRRLKPLSASYIEQRKRRGVTGEGASPAKSNLTNTGQMLDAMRGNSSRSGEIEVRILETRRKGGQTNAEVAGYVRNERPFLALTKTEFSQLKRDLRNAMVNFIRRR